MDTIRFLQMADEGREDYTRERKAWLRKNQHEISREIRGLKKKQALCFFLRQEESPERISHCACHPQRHEEGSYSDCQQNAGCG
ncbi:MAG TPA: hypothetical protein VFG36_02860 [Methanoregula sp.]|nr:hypothetical protein [Methanoregula sp.]